MFTNTFIIHMDHETQKRTLLEEQLRREQVPYEFVSAVDGQNDDLSQYTFSVLSSWSEPFTRKTVTRGEIGCALSHYRLWERIVRDQLPYTLILEDDAVLCSDFLRKSEVLQSFSYEFMYLGRKPLHTDEIAITPSIVRAKYSYGTHAYVLSYEGAQKLLKGNYLQHLIPIDEYLPLIYDADYPHKEYISYFTPVPLVAYSVTPLLVDIQAGELYKSTTYHTDPYTSSSSEDYLVLSVGTSPNDALSRFEHSCQTYGHPYKILGRNTEWKGGVMANGPGGGQKINFLYEELSTWSEQELERIVLFTDSYDVFFVAHRKEVLEKYHALNTSSILFSTEPTCWPDPELACKYPSPHYLNSGGFIGKASLILSILTRVEDSIDDQLYYTLHFLQGSPIVLDLTCSIFQTLNQSPVELKPNGRVQNQCSQPCILHGNGPPHVKRYVNSLENYLLGWSSTYSYCVTKQLTTHPLVYVCTDTLPSLVYPQNRLIHRSLPLDKVVSNFLSTDAEYLLVIEPAYVLTNPTTLTHLLNMKKTIVGPMLKKVTNEWWSNFWGDITEHGYYHRSFDYMDIVQYKKRAVWNVPYLTGVYLIQRSFLELHPDVYASTSMDMDMAFAKYVRDANYFMYVSNLEPYGYIEEPLSFTSLTTLWVSEYLHPDYRANQNQLETICEEKCQDVFYFPLFTKQFCDELIRLCEENNSWSSGRSDVIDTRLNTYENIPTRDIHLHQMKLDALWEDILFRYIAPVASKMYHQYTTKGVNIAFVAKYSMDGQRELKPHHDASTYTVNICLNDDFEGGGCHFIRQNYFLEHRQVGYVSMHPGRLTHYHEGRQLTAGTRYILVSFIQ